MENYILDPFLVTLDRFYDLTLSKKLLPGRRSLQENMEQRFQILKELGIGNMGELLRILKTKQKVEEITNTSGIPEDYLNLLRK